MPHQGRGLLAASSHGGTLATGATVVIREATSPLSFHRDARLTPPNRTKSNHKKARARHDDARLALTVSS
jgi:hypothetical protein